MWSCLGRVWSPDKKRPKLSPVQKQKPRSPIKKPNARGRVFGISYRWVRSKNKSQDHRSKSQMLEARFLVWHGTWWDRLWVWYDALGRQKKRGWKRKKVQKFSLLNIRYIDKPILPPSQKKYNSSAVPCFSTLNLTNYYR
jgi:hypothetical protein